ncbi:MAG: hypothetical protein QME94_11230 [Anaerolineae bacterium]|nr:hypothetical protein [Anaerolineae bacterium]
MTPVLRRQERQRWLIALGALLIAACACSVGAPRVETVRPPTPDGACLQVYVLYSTSCLQCRYMKPAAERLAHEQGGRVRVSLVPAESDEGRRLRQRHAIRCLPAVQIVDAGGRPLGGVRCGFATYDGLLSMVEEALGTSDCGGIGGGDLG